MQNTATDIIDITLMDKEKAVVDSQSAGAWTWALALVKAAGCSPSSDVLALAEREKRGEITTKDIIKYLNEKYKAKERD